VPSRLDVNATIILVVRFSEVTQYSAESAFLILDFCDADLLDVIMGFDGRGLPEVISVVCIVFR
jgi:hypothetical protein